MKKTAAVGAIVVVCMGLLSGCGTNYNTKEDTIFLLKDGKVVSTDIEDFDQNTYSKNDLENYVDEVISAYNEEHGKGTVEKKKLEVEDNNAVLTLEYASVEDYATFNGVVLFLGSIAETLAEGYKFEEEFASIDGKTAVACEVAEILEQDGLKVAVIDTGVNVNVPGKILYASARNTKIIDKNTIGFDKGKKLIGEEIETVTEEVENVTEEIETESEIKTDELLDENVESDGSISEDEFDLGIDEEVTFEFKEDEISQEIASNEYIYVVYK